MLVLGIETSCDDTSIALIREGDAFPEILVHEKFSQEFLLEKWGGVVPEIAARNHLEKLVPLLDQSFKKANLTPSEIDLIAVTTLPGLLGPLLTGLNTAKTLSLIHKKPILPVNHLYAHLEAIHLTEDVSYPYLGVLVSGGHSIFFLVKSASDFVVLGSTIDDAAGEAFDKGGRLMNLPYPAGKFIDDLAKKGDKKRFEFPIGLKNSADCRLSYSGLKTSLSVFLEKNPEIHQKLKDNIHDQDVYDLCASYQGAIIRALELKLRYAIKKACEITKVNTIVVGGGVACNSALRETLKSIYTNCHFVAPKYCTDNGAMIANYALRTKNKMIPFPQCLSVDARGRYISKDKHGQVTTC